MRRTARLTTLGATILAATLLFAGCSAGGSADEGGAVTGEQAGAPMAPEVAGGDAVTDGDVGFASEETAREVIVTG